MERNEAHSWPAPLAGRVPRDADVAQVADAVVAVWLEIDDALHPIIGRRGVAALYSRSLELAAARHSWLASGQRDPLTAVDTSALHAALVQQAAPEAAAAGSAHFASFLGVLSSLVGHSLSERLLQPVWAHSTGASPAQDTTS